MLVVSRHVSERIVCLLPGGEQIEVILVRLGPTAARIGIEAPAHVQIVRAELLEPAPAEPVRDEDLEFHRPLQDGPPPPAEACGDVEMAHDLRQAEAL